VNQITVPAEADEQRQQITTPRISAEIQAVVAEIDARSTTWPTVSHEGVCS